MPFFGRARIRRNTAWKRRTGRPRMIRGSRAVILRGGQRYASRWIAFGACGAERPGRGTPGLETQPTGAAVAERKADADVAVCGRQNGSYGGRRLCQPSRQTRIRRKPGGIRPSWPPITSRPWRRSRTKPLTRRSSGTSRPRIKAYLQLTGLPAEAAEELAQETMFRVWRNAHCFDVTRGAATTWVYQIARNLRRDGIRYEKISRAARGIVLEADIYAAGS